MCCQDAFETMPLPRTLRVGGTEKVERTAKDTNRVQERIILCER